MNIENHDFFKKIVDTVRASLTYVGIFSCFINILMLTAPIYMLQMFDRVIPSQSNSTLIFLTIFAICALIVFGLLSAARSFIMIRTSRWFDEMLAPEAFARTPDHILYGNNYGAQALRDISTIRQFFSSDAVFAFFDAPWVPIYLGVIFLLNPWLGFLALAGAIILFTFALANEILTRKPLASANAHSIEANQFVESTLRNAEVIQAMGMMKGLINKWSTKNKVALSEQANAADLGSMITSISKSTRFILQLLMLGTGAYLVVTGELTAGGMIAGSILLGRALQPVEMAISAWKNFINVRQSYKRLERHFSISMRDTSDIELPDPEGNIQVADVTFMYPNTRKPIISNMTFNILAGRCVGIIGPSGAGKSTLLSLIVGALKPVAGTVRLDGAEVYQWERSHFGKYIGYLPQDIELFSGTVKDNIARFQEYDDKDVIDAAKLAGVHNLILQLPDGYDTQINVANFKLSGGQKQRIGLARAVYKTPKVIVLDEPNSNLDKEGEAALLNAMETLKKNGHTIVVIAHATPILRHVDQLLYIANGQAQLYGPRDDVLNKLQEAAQKMTPNVKQVKLGGK